MVRTGFWKTRKGKWKAIKYQLYHFSKKKNWLLYPLLLNVLASRILGIYYHLPIIGSSLVVCQAMRGGVILRKHTDCLPCSHMTFTYLNRNLLIERLRVQDTTHILNNEKLCTIASYELLRRSQNYEIDRRIGQS